MKILYLASVRIPNEKASGLAIMRQCEAFAKIGHEVTLLKPHRNNHIREDAFAFYGIGTHFAIREFPSVDLVDTFWKFGFYLTRFSQMLVSFAALLKNRNDFDLLYARDPWMLVLPTIFLKKKTIVWEAHQVQKGFFVKMIANNVSEIICISNGLKQHYEKIAPKQKIAVEPSGVNMEQFKNAPSQSDARKFLGIPPEPKVVGYIGKYKTMGEEKGIDDLVQAFATVHREVPDTHLLIAGLEAHEIPLIQTVCVSLGIEESAVSLLSLAQKDFVMYVQATDVLVMNYPDTEHYRNFMSPTKLFAYMASGKIVVTSDLPSVREIVDNSMVIFIKSNNTESLVGKIQQLVVNNNNGLASPQIRIAYMEQFTWVARSKRILARLEK